MPNSSEISLSVQERLGRKRFKSGIEFEKQILNVARAIQRRLLDNLPSNYPKDQNTNIAETFLAVAEEFARLRSSTSQVNEDRYHNSTQAQYLYEILGDTLFLDKKAINTLISDEAYRNYLIKVRNAYYGGSRKENIQSSVSDIIGLPVKIKELYLDLRRADSFYTLKDTHTMFFDIMMDYVTSTSAIGLLLENVKFFIDLIKPAHVLYDTRLIWTDRFTNRSGKCESVYVPKEISEIVYNADRIYLITYVVSRLYQSIQDDPDETWDSGTVSSIDHNRSIIYLTNKRILVITSNSSLYRRTYDPSNDPHDTVIKLSDLNVGDIVRYYSVRDTSSNSNVIEDSWIYEATISSIDEIDEVITLASGKKIVYNSDVLVYTRDGQGEYRILISGLEPELDPQRIIRFRASKHTSGHDFYNTPPQVADNAYKEFDQDVIDRPYYQGNVKKDLATRGGLPEGPAVVVLDGVATVINVNGRFYKRLNSETYAEFDIYRYSLYINNEFQEQFSLEEPDDPITEDQAKVVFEDTYGYSFTGTNSDYRIDVDITAHLKQATKDTTIQGITGATEFCDRKAECLLSPSYEDVRTYWEYPDLKLTSGFIIAGSVLKVEDPPGQHNLGAYFKISSDPNVPIPALLPLLNLEGDPASKEDLVVYIDGLKVDDAVTSVDPWTGDIVLNFLPPANTTTRIDYYYADRFPKPWSYTEQIGSEDKSQRLLWPYPLTETGAYNLGGGLQDFQVDQFPIVDKQGNIATASEVEVYQGELSATGLVVGTEQSEVGDTLIVDGGVSGIEPGDTMIIYAENYLDNTIKYDIIGVTGTNKIVTDKEFAVDFGSTGFTYDVLRFTGAPYSVDDIRPLLGHIHLETGPANGSYVKFEYYYQYRNRYFAMVPDVPGDTSPYMNMGYTADTKYGPYAGYTLIPDLGYTGVDQPWYEYDQVGKKGYRYRAFNLSNSSVLDSKDTLVSDGYKKYEGEGSWRNNRNRLDDYEVMFSPEHLTDRDKNVILNDAYLEKKLPANTQLYPGTPLFVQTYSDDAHYRMQDNPTSESTYQEPTAMSHDLPAGFMIIGADESGLVDYEGVCDYEENQRLSLYSNLRVVEQDIEGYDGPLSTITEGMRTLPVSTSFVELYYPNREKRINDYLDYINKVPDEIREGRLKALKNSPIIKKVEGLWLNLKIGDVLEIKDVGYRKYSSVIDEYEIAYKNVSYTVIEIIDYETARLSASFKELTGEYAYELIRDRIYAADVMLNEVNRTLVLNGVENFDYGLPPAVLAGFAGYGDTGAHAELYFPDPDPDPYPRSPDNPNITGYPTGDRSVLLSKESDLGPTDINLIPLVSEVIGWDGNPVSVTGIGGFTGPSGAVDLGLTGPTGIRNPRIQEADDKYIVPSGESGALLSYSEAEHRVHWRNWDQELLIVTIGSSTGPAAGVLEEEPMGLLDDLAEGIKRNYWNVDDEALTANYYFGTVVETSEQIEAAINPSLYPEALILLTENQANAIASSGDPKSDFPWLDPTVTTYNLRRLIVREILQDNTIKITEIQELDPV